jgi:hypothetical protein
MRGRPFRRPRITRQAQKASQREAETPLSWDAYERCDEIFHRWKNKQQYTILHCIKHKDHKSKEHKAPIPGGVVRWTGKVAVTGLN